VSKAWRFAARAAYYSVVKMAHMRVCLQVLWENGGRIRIGSSTSKTTAEGK